MHVEPRFVIDSPLPPGRMITSDEGDGEAQPLWLSDGSATGELWTRVYAEHTRAGLWPLLLHSLDPSDGQFRPWGSGEIFPEQMSSPASHDPARLLAQWWATYTAVDEDDDMLDTDRRLAVTAPFGQTWPGLAPSRETAINPDHLASEYAQAFLADRPQTRLGLVAAASGAEALAVVGWDGPCNYDNDTAKFSAVLRDWEQTRRRASAIESTATSSLNALRRSSRGVRLAIFPSCSSIRPREISTAGVCVGRSPARQMLSGASSATARAWTQ
ncbi:hypothetical protein GCM10010207_78740 [Streptomyces atratus]|nr:hypothetical protein GCM10010207_78740 [Streptomyces atratus]